MENIESGKKCRILDERVCTTILKLVIEQLKIIKVFFEHRDNMLDISSESKISWVTMQIKVNELKGDQKDKPQIIECQTRLMVVEIQRYGFFWDIWLIKDDYCVMN